MEKHDAVAALGSLAHEIRLDIFRLLVQAGPGGLPAGELAGRLGIAGPNLTFHLSHMRQAGLVVSRRSGRNVIYAADYRRMTGLIGYLNQNCCAGVSPGVDDARAESGEKEPAQ